MLTKEGKMSTASLELLKGSPAKAMADEPGPDDPAATADPGDSEEEEVVVDIDKLTGKELDALVKEHEVETPDGWAKMPVAAKKDWLKATFGDAAEEAADPEDSDQPTAKTSSGALSTEVIKTLEPTDMVGGDDLIIDIVQTVENLKEKEARELVVQLCEGAEFTFFKLGGVLSVIQANGWYAPYGSFKDYVETERGINYRTARYWISIYNGIVESGVPWVKVKHLGWTKLKEIVPVLTLDNVDHWVAVAEKQTTLQLIETVKKAQLPGEMSEADGEAKTVTTKTFKVHDDQRATIEAALAKCREIAQTQVDTVALEYICLDYLNGFQGKGTVGSGQTSDLKSQFQSILEKHDGDGEAALGEIFKSFEQVFPKVNLTVEYEEDD
jgi:hypothetical protein